MGPEDQHPWDREDEEIRQAFAKKEAEIERLKAQIARLQEQGFHDQVELLRLTGEVGPDKNAEIERLKESAKYDAFLREKYRALITEFCDALKDIRTRYDVGHGYIELERQGREATR